MHVILDIDGTLADAEHRIHHVKQTPPNWEAFLSPELVAKDSPIPAAQKAIQKMQDLRYNLVCITGRNENLRDVTSTWLLQHYNLITDDYNLLMRSRSNMFKASEYKQQQMQLLLAEYKARGDNSFIFIDDDPNVFALYSAEGIVLRAPACWDVVFPVHVDSTTEELWRA